jgi:hypothetical protein
MNGVSHLAPTTAAKPWLRAGIPAEVDFPRGMLGPEERRMLFWAAAAGYTGAGVLVDAGAFAGASAFCLAAGLSRSAHRGAPCARVHSYDLFVAQDEYVREAIGASFKPVESGGSYRDVFEFQTALYRDLIEVHEGDFLTQPVPDDRIELLFVDVAKTAELNDHVLRQYFPRLIPGRSLIVQQDYYHAWHPYIHIAMERLKIYFELVDPWVHHQSRVWRLTRPIPESELSAAASAGVMPDEGARLLDAAAAADEGDTAQMVKVVKLWHLLSHGERDAAAAFAGTLPPPGAGGDALWARELASIRARLQA